MSNGLRDVCGNHKSRQQTLEEKVAAATPARLYGNEQEEQHVLRFSRKP